MPITETIAIVNKSGKLVGSVSNMSMTSQSLLRNTQSKHIVNLFKDAKDAYQEKKAELQAEHKRKDRDRMARVLRDSRDDEAEYAATRHRSSHTNKGKDKELPIRPALTERNLSMASEGSVTSSRRSSYRGERSSRSPKPTSRSHKTYQAPYFENADISRSDLVRRHTDHSSNGSPPSPRAPPGYGPLRRSSSNPHYHEEIDMGLAYGDIPPSVAIQSRYSVDKEQELQGLMSKFDKLMIEAHCLQHSASAIIGTLQKNPEAMAAVALTLAEISNIIAKMSPGVVMALKGSSPALFALLASPQFLIGTGLAVGVTIVAFGGYKIIKKIQKDIAEKKEANRMDEALTFEGDLNSIESWRRGIAEVEAQSVATSVDGEFITPEAARIRKERIRDRAKEERRDRDSVAPSVARSSTSTIKRKEIPRRTSSKSVTSESIRSEVPRRTSSKSVATESVRSGSVARTESTVKPSKKDTPKEKKVKKPSALTVLFKKSSKKSEATESRAGDDHQPGLPKRIDL